MDRPELNRDVDAPPSVHGKSGANQNGPDAGRDLMKLEQRCAVL